MEGESKKNETVMVPKNALEGFMCDVRIEPIQGARYSTAPPLFWFRSGRYSTSYPPSPTSTLWLVNGIFQLQ
jgi:hypothetical protein